MTQPLLLPGLAEILDIDVPRVDAEYAGFITRDPVKRQWAIACEPHVMRMLKRFFERIPKETPTGVAPLADSPANAKTLLWFMAGQPLKVSEADMAHLRTQAQIEATRQRGLTRVLTGKYTPTVFKVGIEPWPFQYLPAELTLVGGGVLCADDTGLGKTLSGTLLISDLRARPALVVCPKQLVAQWVRKLAEYLPGSRVHVLSRREPYPLPDPFPDVLVCTYAKLSGWAQVLGRVLRCVVYDEIHNLCHEWGPPPRTGEERKRIAKYEAALHLRDRVAYRCGLSATPIKNYGGEARIVMNVLLEDALGNEEEFGLQWCKGAKGEKAIVDDPRALGAAMVRQGLMTNRTREDVGKYLPPVMVNIQPVEVDMKRLNAVKVETLEYAKTLLRRGGDPEEKRRAGGEIDWKLRHATGLAKATAVIEFVKIVASTTPVLLLGWHHDFWALMARGLWDFKPSFFTGQQSDKQKERALAAFLAGDSMVIGMSHRAAEGLDGLQTVCSTIVVGELDWSYSQMMKQNVGRLQREGQKQNVFAHIMLADEGSDPPMADALGIKRGQLEGMLRPDAPMVEVVQNDPKRTKELARAWLASHDPKALREIEKEIADAEQTKAEEKEARRAKRKGGGHAPEPPPPPVRRLFEVHAPVVHVIDEPAASAPPALPIAPAAPRLLVPHPPAPPTPPSLDPWLARLRQRGR